MHLDIQNPGILYSLFFALAHVVSWIILILYGYKHNYRMVHWLLIIVSGYICFTTGSNFLAVDAEGIKGFFKDGVWPASQGKSLVSGLLLAVPAMILMKQLLGFRRAIFEPYAFTIPLGIAIQRFGCLAAGCCYGKTTDSFVGITYSFGHNIHYQYWESGMLANIDQASIALHPVQVYESILCLFSLALIFIIYKKGWMKGRLVYVYLLFYTIIRFVTEFFRASEAHTIGTNTYSGLNSIQWIMIFSFVFLLYVITKKRKVHTENRSTYSIHPLNIKEYLWYILLFGLILISSTIYTPLERLLLGVLFIPLSCLVFWQFFELITLPKLRLASVSLCVLAIFIMSQSDPLDVKNEDFPIKYHEVSIGGYAGVLDVNHYSVGCDNTRYYDYEFLENYYLIGAGYKYVTQFDSDKKLTIGLSASFGEITEHLENSDKTNSYGADINYTYSQNMYSISPYVQYDLKKIGFGLGLNAGDISVFRPERAPFTIFQRYSLLPLVHFRFGNQNKFWTEFNYGYRFPGFAPANEFEILLGAKGKAGNIVRFGTSAYHAIVIRPEFRIKNKLTVEPYIGIFGPMFSSSFETNKAYQGGINLHYRIYQ